MKTISIIILIMNLFLFCWKFFEIKLNEVFLVSDFELLYNYLPLALFIMILLLLGLLIVKYLGIWQKDWKDRITFYTVLFSFVGTIYFVYDKLLIGTYFETIEKYSYLYVIAFAILFYFTLWLLYMLYTSIVTFIRGGNFLKAGPAFFGLLLLLYVYWVLIDYLFKSIL